MARERPELREESVRSLLKQSGQLWRTCLIPVLILALVSALYSYALEIYAVNPSLALSELDGGSSALSQRANSSLAHARASQDPKTSRESFQGRLQEGADDKGFLARYLAMFLTSFDEAIMESFAESREKLSMYDSRGADSKTAALKLESPRVNHPSQVSDGATTTSEASSKPATEEASEEASDDNEVGGGEPIPQFSFKLKYLGKNKTSEMVNLHEEKVGIGMPSARLMGGRNLDRGAMPHLGLTLLFMLGVAAGALMGFFAVVMCQHAALLGTIAYSVVSTYVGKRVSTVRAMKAGLRSGMVRLMWLAVLRGMIRDLVSLLVMKAFVGGLIESDRADRLALRLSFMPFAILAPFRDAEATNVGMAARIGGFMFVDYVFEAAISCVYIVACWVTIMEREYWGFAALSRAWRLMSSMQNQVIAVKLLEGVLCGRSARWILQQFMGPFLSLLVVSAGQVYFVVCWLVFYFSARCKQDTNPRFSHRVLEDFLDRLR